MTPVLVKWARDQHVLWDRQAQANITLPDRAIPVVELAALKKAIESIGHDLAGENLDFVVGYERALKDLLAQLGDK